MNSNEKNIKQKRLRLETASAVLMLLLGSGMSIAGFCVNPVGEISDSVLWLLAQSLIYAGSIFGVSVYVQRKLDDVRDLVNTTTNQL